MADFLTLADLYSRANPRTVRGYFDDDNTGVVQDADANVQAVFTAAEAEMYARLMRAYPGDPSEAGSPMQLLVENDPALKGHVIYVALQLAAERRVEFTGSDGVGPYKVQWDRAIAYFDTLSKGLMNSRGERAAGRGANSGGNASPRPPVYTASQFVFAPSKKSPTGHGGF